MHDAQRAAGEDEAFVVEAAHEDFGAVAFAAHDVFLGHFGVFEHQLTGVGAAHAEFVELLGLAESRGVAFHNKGGDAAWAG